MRAAVRTAARALGMALVLSSCGLVARSGVAVAPDVVTRHPDGAGGALAAQPVAFHGQTPTEQLMQKAVSPAEPAVVAKPTLPAASTAPMKHIWQSLNNCGPAAVVMALSTMGVEIDQETARLALRGPDWARGMGPAPVGPWVQDRFDLRMQWRTNGTHELMKVLISNGFAPMVTQWMQDPWISRIGHWRTVAGYDDAKGMFYVNDSMLGRGVGLSYEWFDRNWQPFSYRWMVVYKPEDEPLLRTIVGPDWSDRGMRQRFYDRAKGEALQRGDAQSWLTYGEASYQNGLFAEAVAAFEKGLALGSAQGVSTLRSSYPAALRALGRDQEAQSVQQQLSASSTVPTTVANPPDRVALYLALERSRAAGEAVFTE
ncbi:MAG: hypothetical protein FJ028_04680 [Chloroflexi bacterium]|nr:hypothetical protein [Chloroflexota bacterium]